MLIKLPLEALDSDEKTSSVSKLYFFKSEAIKTAFWPKKPAFPLMK